MSSVVCPLTSEGLKYNIGWRALLLVQTSIIEYLWDSAAACPEKPPSQRFSVNCGFCERSLLVHLDILPITPGCPFVRKRHGLTGGTGGGGRSGVLLSAFAWSALDEGQSNTMMHCWRQVLMTAILFQYIEANIVQYVNKVCCRLLVLLHRNITPPLLHMY